MSEVLGLDQRSCATSSLVSFGITKFDLLRRDVSRWQHAFGPGLKDNYNGLGLIGQGLDLGLVSLGLGLALAIDGLTLHDHTTRSCSKRA